jgi:hypothetical protein
VIKLFLSISPTKTKFDLTVFISSLHTTQSQSPVSQSPVGARSSSPLSHDAAPASGDAASPATATTTTTTAVASPVRQRRVLEPGDGEIFPFQVSGHDLMLRTRRGNVRQSCLDRSCDAGSWPTAVR